MSKTQLKKDMGIFDEISRRFYRSFNQQDTVESAYYYKMLKEIIQHTGNQRYNNRIGLLNLTINQSGDQNQIEQLKQVHQILKAGLV